MKKLCRYLFATFLLSNGALGQVGDLTQSPWRLRGTDSGGQSWYADLVFLTQMPSGPDWIVTGHFDWVDDPVQPTQWGQEQFTGMVASLGALSLSGTTVVDHPTFGPATFTATSTYGGEVVSPGDGIVGWWPGTGPPPPPPRLADSSPQPKGRLRP